ncbi:zinc finger CCCH-type containing 11A S homeolog [Xenopus laevis]|uniref:LOC100049151 protein n=1 Tax=Xenopus laevis TaxID=8355 RepID=A4QNS6_XENLA|nr:zinc finger CCCH-type containing 11A S homeolog [Xenopus laevis]AAI39501.1 LOC100049151 protein [Xenopus laevis]
MSNQGEDCYFYFYSTCTKGDDCPFRHCEAAVGSETVCTLWKEGQCFRQICKFRHMEMNKKRSEIPCYWENQPSGCQKGNCAFHHTKGRFVDGVFMPPSNSSLPKPEPSTVEPPTSQLSLTQVKLSVASAPQIRGVKKIEANENIPSPTHPPVVINAADDDEDDDDLISEEGDEMKNTGQLHSSSIAHQGTRIISTRNSATPQKIIKDTSLNFGIKTLEEIKLKRQKGEQNSQADAMDGSSIQTAPGEDMIVRTVSFYAKDKSSMCLSLAQRLGKRTAPTEENPLADSVGECVPSAKKSLHQRLGRRITPHGIGIDAKKVRSPRPLKERLGLPTEQNSVETEKAARPAPEFHIKTLQEIQQEKANQKQQQKSELLPCKSKVTLNAETGVAPKMQPSLHIKTFSEKDAEKRHRQLKVKTHVSQEEKKYKLGSHRDEIHKNDHGTKRPRTEEQQGEAGKEVNPVKTTLTENVHNKKEMKSELKGNYVAGPVNLKRPHSSLSPPRSSAQEAKGTSQSIEQVRVKTLEEIRREKAQRLQQVSKQEKTQSEESQPQPLSKHKRILRISKPAGNREKIKNEKESNSGNSLKVTCVKPSPKKLEEEMDKSYLHPLESQRLKKTSVKSSLDVSNTEHTKLSGTDLEQTHEGKTKEKPKVNIEPHVVKKHLPSKSTIKVKVQEIPAVAAVQPLSPVTVSAMSEHESTISVVPEASLPVDHPIVSLSSKHLNESEPATPAPFVPNIAKSRRTSTASAGKSNLSTEDEFDKLIWEISEGKLEAEIDLDPSKDEDDLLLELSEMIDS